MGERETESTMVSEELCEPQSSPSCTGHQEVPSSTPKHLLYLLLTFRQLTARLWKLGMRLESCGDDIQPLLRCIACGYCMSAAKFHKMDLHRLSAEVNVYHLIRVTGSGISIHLLTVFSILV